MKKEKLKKIKGLLYGIGLGLIPLSGCTKPDESTDVVGYLKNNDYKQENVGFLKVNEQIIPYYKYDQRYFFMAKGYYSYETGDYIGKLNNNDATIVFNKNILYASEQIIPFVECNPNAEYNYKTISSFTEETYKNLEESYFANHFFSSKHFRVYEILNLTTNEVNYVIGRKVSGTKVFNFETYMIEDYTGYAIKDMEVVFEKEEYYYDEILDFIANYREQNQSLSLGRK